MTPDDPSDNAGETATSENSAGDAGGAGVARRRDSREKVSQLPTSRRQRSSGAGSTARQISFAGARLQFTFSSEYSARFPMVPQARKALRLRAARPPQGPSH